MIPRTHLTKAEQAKLEAELGKLDDAAVQAIRDRLASLQALRKEKEYTPNVSAYVPTLSPYVRGSKAETAYKELLKGRARR